MSKIQRVIINCATLILMNILFWLCNLYPRHIFLPDSNNSVIQIILNVLFFLVYYYVLIAAFEKNKTISSKSISNKKDIIKNIELPKVLCLLIVQILTDLLFRIIEHIPLQWYIIVSSIILLLNWILVYLLISGIQFKAKKYVWFLVIILILLSCSFCIDMFLVSDYRLLAERYTEDAPIILATRTNLRHIFSIKTLIYDSFVGIAIVVFHNISNNVKEHSHKSTYRNFARFLSRMVVILIAVPILFNLKIVIHPYGSWYGSSSSDVNIKNHESNGEFDIRKAEYKVYRYSLDNDSNNICYQEYKFWISKDNLSPISISTTNSNGLYSHIIIDGIVLTNDITVNCSTDTVVGYLYGGQVICYYDENNNPHAVDINNMNVEKQENLIALCEKLLKDGNAFIFEYVYKYLMSYDTEFILPYIDRYAKGIFTENEYVWMQKCFYKSEYLIALARTIQE